MATSLIDALMTAWLDESKSSFYIYAEKPHGEDKFYGDSAAIFCKDPEFITEENKRGLIQVVNVGHGPNYYPFSTASMFKGYVRTRLKKGEDLKDICYSFINYQNK